MSISSPPNSTGVRSAYAQQLKFGSVTSDRGAELAALKSKFVGCLFGLAVGDALGCNLETLTPQQIRERVGVQTEIVGGRATAKFDAWARGATTDDTAMALILADNLIAYPDGNMWDLRDRFVQWFKTNPPGLGGNTRDVLRNAEAMVPGRDSFDKASKDSWERLGRATNGSIMRCAPIALLHHKNPDKVRALSDDSCRVTHYAPACRASTIAFNRVLASLVNNEPSDKSALRQRFEQIAQEVAVISPETARILRAVPTMQKDQLSTTSNTLDTLQVALWALYNFDSLEEAVVTVVNMGGDTDTNGAVVGALFGAKLGENAVPARWREVLLEKNQILAMSNRLFEAGYPPEPTRQG